MAMNEDYCSYELSKALKACGFDEPCDSYYDKACASDDEYWHTKRGEAYNWNGLDSDCQISAPTLAHAQKWLRERAIEVDVTPIFSHGGRDGYDWDVYDDFSGYPAIRGALPFAETYEQALSAGIFAALELIKKGE